MNMGGRVSSLVVANESYLVTFIGVQRRDFVFDEIKGCLALNPVS